MMNTPDFRERVLAIARSAGSHEADLRVRLVDNWLELTANVDVGLSPLGLWSMLGQNAACPGSARAAWLPGDDRPRIRGDLFVDESSVFDGDIERLCASVQSTRRALIGRCALDTSVQPGADCVTTGGTPSAIRDLEALCVEAGWPLSQRDEGTNSIRIDCRDRSHMVDLAIGGDGTLHACADLGETSSLSLVSRTAMAVLLLTASAVVRSIKGVVVIRDGREHIGLASADRVDTATALDRALSSLAVACDLAGRESGLLRHEDLARRYLLAWAPPLFDADDPGAIDHDVNEPPHEKEKSPCLQQL